MLSRAAPQVLVGPGAAVEGPALPAGPAPRLDPDALALHSRLAVNPAAGAALAAADAVADTGWAAELALAAVSDWGAAPEVEAEEVGKQGHLLGDIVRAPESPSAAPPLPPAVLAWNDRTVPRLAEAICEERRMPDGALDNAR